jgi:hypothetical protein
MVNKTMDEIPHLPFAAERAISSRAFLDVMRMISETYTDSPDFGANSALIMIFIAIMLGHAERRLMTAGDISAYTGIPRATVLRKLASETAKRHIGSAHRGIRRVYWLTVAAEPVILRRTQDIVRRACREIDALTKTDI